MLAAADPAGGRAARGYTARVLQMVDPMTT